MKLIAILSRTKQRKPRENLNKQRNQKYKILEPSIDENQQNHKDKHFNYYLHRYFIRQTINHTIVRKTAKMSNLRFGWIYLHLQRIMSHYMQVYKQLQVAAGSSVTLQKRRGPPSNDHSDNEKKPNDLFMIQFVSCLAYQTWMIYLLLKVLVKHLFGK